MCSWCIRKWLAVTNITSEQVQIVDSCVKSILDQLHEEGKTFSNFTTEDFFHQTYREFSNLGEQVQKRVSCEFLGYGPLENLLADPMVTEIFLAGADCIHYEKSGKVLRYLHDQFRSPTTYSLFCQKIFSEIGVEPTLERPVICANWGVHRIHIVAPPVTENFQFSIRLHRMSSISLTELANIGSVAADQRHLLERALGNRDNILIFGSTGSGKTTLVRAFLQSLPENERIVIAEDTPELQTPNPVSISMMTRHSFETGEQISLSQLVRESLRMRPDRIVLGEVRGPEAKDLVLALSSGHTGSFGTIHARTAREALARLEVFVQMGAPQWDKATVRRLIFDSVNLVVGLERSKDGKRRVCSINRLSSLEEFGITLDSEAI